MHFGCTRPQPMPPASHASARLQFLVLCLSLNYVYNPFSRFTGRNRRDFRSTNAWPTNTGTGCSDRLFMTSVKTSFLQFLLPIVSFNSCHTALLSPERLSVYSG